MTGKGSLRFESLHKLRTTLSKSTNPVSQSMNNCHCPQRHFNYKGNLNKKRNREKAHGSIKKILKYFHSPAIESLMDTNSLLFQGYNVRPQHSQRSPNISPPSSPTTQGTASATYRFQTHLFHLLGNFLTFPVSGYEML